MNFDPLDIDSMAYDYKKRLITITFKNGKTNKIKTSYENFKDFGGVGVKILNLERQKQTRLEKKNARA